MTKPEMFSLAGEDLPAEPEAPQFTEDEAMLALKRLEPLRGATAAPSWVDIATHLGRLLEVALEEVINSDSHARVIANQARVKLLRDLIDLPEWVNTEIARYREAIETGKD